MAFAQPLCASPPHRPVILSVEGLIGAGKSTLLSRVKEQLGARVHIVQEGVALWRALPNARKEAGDEEKEKTHNLLASYYAEPDKYAVPFQVFTLATRVQALHEALAHVATLPLGEQPEFLLVERSSGGDACFATMLHTDGTIDDAWFSAYTYMRALYARFVPEVDGIIDMDVPVEAAMTRLYTRARGEEVGVSPAYQARLATTIRKWLDAETEGKEKTKPIMRLDQAALDDAHVDDARARSLAHAIAAFARAIRFNDGAVWNPFY